MEDKDLVSKWAVDAERLINPMPAYQLNPDNLGPVIRDTNGRGRQLVHARWGLPSPRFALEKAAKAPLCLMRVALDHVRDCHRGRIGVLGLIARICSVLTMLRESSV